MLYTVFAGIVLLVATTGLALHFKHPKKLHRLLKHHLNRKEALMVFAPLIILSATGIAFIVSLDQTPRQTSQKQTIDEDTNKKQPATAGTGELPAYEILSQKTTDSTKKRLTVYVLTKDEKLVKNLDTKLRTENQKPPVKSVSIDYFDDKVVAATFFEKVKDKNISVELRKQLASHYIAVSSTDLTTDSKIIFLNQKSLSALQGQQKR